MAVFSRFSRVLESSGQSMTVRTALALINQILGEVLTEQEDEFDAETRWALAWFGQKGFAEGEFGDANTLATAALLRKLGSRAEVARDLGYRLFRVTEKLHSQDAQAYKALVLAWPDLVKLAQAAPGAKSEQEKLL